jgi:phosphatidylethanolamine-binding protein (PEBP) family uncharacterized protein
MYRDSFLVRKLFPFLVALFALANCTQSSSNSSSKNLLTAAALYTYSSSSSNICTGTSSTLTVSSSLGVSGTEIGPSYACTLNGGSGYSPDLSWSGCPASTKGFAMIMYTVALDGTKYNWLLYNIPSTTYTLPKNSTTIGTAGLGSNGPTYGYQAPCSSQLGVSKEYTFTVYALSSAPTLSGVVTGAVLTSAISSITVASGSIILKVTQ